MPHSAQNIAHDLRNDLTIIIAACESTRPDVSIILAAALRCRDILEPKGAPAIFDLNEVAIDVYDAIQGIVDPHRIEVLLELTHERFFAIGGDRLKMHRALQNICLNAMAAVRKQLKPGRIKIETKVDGTDAVVSVADNGVGMTADEVNRLSTIMPAPDQEHGRGFGIVRSTVEELGGRIDVKSEPGKGSIFKIVIPLSTENAGTCVA